MTAPLILLVEDNVGDVRPQQRHHRTLAPEPARVGERAAPRQIVERAEQGRSRGGRHEVSSTVAAVGLSRRVSVPTYSGGRRATPNQKPSIAWTRRVKSSRSSGLTT